MPSKLTIGVVFLVSLGVWITFRLLTPEAPLTAGETAVVVAICGGVVVGGQHLLALLRKKKT